MGYFFIFLMLLLATIFKVYGDVSEKSTKALFIFGDSTVDPGNNKYINTIPENRADYKPYGQNGFFKAPTGRFSDGRIIVDYIAEYARLPLIPPFMEKTSDYTSGANFASGGAGVLPETNQGMVIDLQTQLKNFEEIHKSLIEKLGETQAYEIITEAVYFFSIGSNDYMGGYLGNPTMQQSYKPQDYVGMVVGNLTQAIQILYEKGARKFGFLGLSPLGCLPALRVLNPNSNTEGGCFEAASGLALAHNNALKHVLSNLEHILQEFKYCISNFFDWLDARIKNPSNYGFKDGMNACCGSGPYRGIYTCGGTKNITEFELCENANEHIWWDSFHPTERIHEQFAQALWNGLSPAIGPYNLHHLFHTKEKMSIADIIDVPDEQKFQ